MRLTAHYSIFLNAHQLCRSAARMVLLRAMASSSSVSSSILGSTRVRLMMSDFSSTIAAAPPSPRRGMGRAPCKALLYMH